MTPPNADSLWIFGYGSLVWRPAFAFLEQRAALVRGYARRFWQGSTDHRGVPGSPGRVVTLLADRASNCWGMAYRVSRANSAEVLSQLDGREQGGYDRREVDLRFSERGSPVCEPNGERAAGLMYVATPENGNFLGEASLDEIAIQVLQSKGPSGDNVEYVLRLAAALRELGAGDEHVFALERCVQQALASDGVPLVGASQ